MFTFKRNQIIITVLVFMIAIAAYLNTKDNASGIEPHLVQETDMSQEGIVEEKDFFEGYDEIETLPPDMDSELFTENIVNGTGEVQEVDGAVSVDQANAETADPTVTDPAAVDPTVAATHSEEPQSFAAIITKKNAMIADSAGSGQENIVAVDKNMDVSYFVEEKILREQSRAMQVEELTQYVANENLDKEAKSKAAENLLAIQERIEKESSAEALLRAKGFKEVYVRIDDNSVDVVVNKENLSESDIAQIEEIVNRKTGYSVGKIKITPLKGIAKEEVNQ
jgi:stage III sporulation protein AH